MKTNTLLYKWIHFFNEPKMDNFRREGSIDSCTLLRIIFGSIIGSIVAGAAICVVILTAITPLLQLVGLFKYNPATMIISIIFDLGLLLIFFNIRNELKGYGNEKPKKEPSPFMKAIRGFFEKICIRIKIED